MVDCICKGLLNMWWARTENYKMKNSCQQWDSNPGPSAYEANAPSVELLELLIKEWVPFFLRSWEMRVRHVTNPVNRDIFIRTDMLATCRIPSPMRTTSEYFIDTYLNYLDFLKWKLWYTYTHGHYVLKCFISLIRFSNVLEIFV